MTKLQGHLFSLLRTLQRPVRRTRTACLTAALAACLPMALPGMAHASAEHPAGALVIGNGAYSEVNTLRNAVNDATQVCKELHGPLDFKTTCAYDVPTRSALQAQIADFVDSLPENAVRIIYYAGHGLQVDGQNYLIPTGLHQPSSGELSVPEQAVSLSYLMRQLSRRHAFLTIIILDACRNNPFPSTGHTATASLGEITDIPDNTMVFYGTSSDGVAIDDQGDNGTLTKNLLVHLRDMGTMDEIFKAVSRGVQNDTLGLPHFQKPELHSNFTGQYCPVRCTQTEVLQQQYQELKAKADTGDSEAIRQAAIAQDKLDKQSLAMTEDHKWRKAARILPTF